MGSGWMGHPPPVTPGKLARMDQGLAATKQALRSLARLHAEFVEDHPDVEQSLALSGFASAIRKKFCNQDMALVLAIALAMTNDPELEVE